jgi:imidazolonepropionase-like amidohydrolase
MIRKISAHYLWLNSETLLKYGVMAFSHNGIIVDIKDNKGIPEESESLEFFNGLIIPGFVDIDIVQVKTKAIRTFTADPKHGLQVELPDHLQFLIIDNPNLLDKADVLRLLALERDGIKVVLKLDAGVKNTQASIFKNVHKLALSGTIDFGHILRWTTINPARCMGIDAMCGTIAPGKQPGLNVVSGIDYTTMSLTENSSIRVII